MRIGVLNTGDELLLGTTLNTHGAWIGQRLLGLGLRVAKQMTLPDGPELEIEVKQLVENLDALIITGGLGPTSDDLTCAAVARALQIELIEDEHALRCVKGFFARMGKEMPPGNLKQALVPCGADVIPNPRGTAPGVYIPPRLGKIGQCAVFLLPGPPSELHPMFIEEVEPRLRALSGVSEADVKMEVMKFVGIGESAFHELVDEPLAGLDLEVGYCARPNELDLRLIGAPDVIVKAKALVLGVVGGHCFSEDGSELEEVVVREFAAKGLTVAFAESCTGGRISSRITDVSGSSAVFTHGFVTYANEAKQSMIGVSAESLAKHGAVSEQVAREMAEGALAAAEADVAVSVTGIAGPTGGTEEKPVGTVWMGIAVRGKETQAILKRHNKTREGFKISVSQAALNAAREAAVAL